MICWWTDRQDNSVDGIFPPGSLPGLLDTPWHLCLLPIPPPTRHQLRCLQERKWNSEVSFPKGQMFLWLLPPIPLMSELNLEQVSNYR